MKESDPTREILKKKGAGGINRDVGVFAFFLFLAFIFWYLNSLGKETEAGIKYSIKYTSIPKDKRIRDESKATLSLFLKGRGSSVLKLKLSGNKAPVAIDLSRVSYRRMPGSKELDYYIVTSGLSKSLAVQLGSGFEVTSVKPDTLFFTLVKKGTIQSAVSENKANGRNDNPGTLK